MIPRRAFTLFELLAILVILAVIAAVLVPMLVSARHRSAMERNANNLRQQHQALIIASNVYAVRLPGLTGFTPTQQGYMTLPAGLATTGSLTDDGSVVASRYWMLLSQGFCTPGLLLHPYDHATVWTTGSVVPANFSYAMLRITGTSADAGRRAEWADNVNASAPLISDRNTGAGNADNLVRSLWTAKPGDWQGHVVWGDNRVTFEESNRLSTTTIYNSVKQTHDNLFATGAAAGVSDNSSQPDANAMMTTTN
ncbi:MAG: hypothetical protein NTW19_19090 [Planctomycetota bacterium]|nr:hypothetical protein [Planctomycetota bacterium]